MGINFSSKMAGPVAIANRCRKLKVFGERNCGTRAAVQMLREARGVSLRFPKPPDLRFETLTARVEATLSGPERKLFKDALIDARLGRLRAIDAWKHTAPQVDDSFAQAGASVLFMVRDPYSWAAALFRHPYHARAPLPKRLEEFLQQPWLTMRRDNIDPVLISPMILWNEKLRAYRRFFDQAPVPATVLKFEDFVLEPVAALGAALKALGISARGLAELERPTKKGGLDAAQRKAWYRARAWEAEISPEAAALVNHFVDWDVAAAFGYDMRPPDSFPPQRKRRFSGGMIRQAETSAAGV